MEAQAVARLDRAIASMFSELGPRFYINRYPGVPQAAFGVAEKLPPGQRTEDGSHIRDHGWITRKQCQIIEQTSQSDAEVKDRIMLLILHKKDTTRMAEKPPAIELSQVEKMVADAVAKALAAVAPTMDSFQRDVITKSISRGAVLDEAIPQEPRVVKPKISGIQMKKRKNKEQYGAEIDKENKLWEDRAQMMGLDKPIYRTRDRRIDRRWINRAEMRWQEYTAAKKANEATEVAPAPTA